LYLGLILLSQAAQLDVGSLYEMPPLEATTLSYLKDLSKLPNRQITLISQNVHKMWISIRVIMKSNHRIITKKDITLFVKFILAPLAIRFETILISFRLEATVRRVYPDFEFC
jgi:hypothetical protein